MVRHLLCGAALFLGRNRWRTRAAVASPEHTFGEVPDSCRNTTLSGTLAGPRDLMPSVCSGRNPTAAYLHGRSRKITDVLYII
jgi:hypothetical protein